MNFDHLRTFVAIADAGGVHRAADRLHLSQPAVSRQIQALESELGVPLFDRIGRRVQLTSEGADLLRQCRSLLADVTSLTERAGALKKGDVGILRVGATPQVIENTLAAFLSRFRELYPGVDVQLVEEGGTNLHGLLERSDLHFALTVVDDERFDYRPLFPLYGLGVISKVHKFARRHTLDIAELAEESILLLRGGFASRAWFESACRVANIRPRVLLESAAPHTGIALAESGYGVAIVPSSVRIPQERVHAVAILQRGAVMGSWLKATWDPRRLLASYAQRFLDELVTYCHRNYPGREFTRFVPKMVRPKERIS